jgi:hypothetical protein
MPDLHVDLINANGTQIQGSFAQQLMNNGKMDIGKRRPFIGADGMSYVSVYVGGDPEDENNHRVYRFRQMLLSAGMSGNSLMKLLLMLLVTGLGVLMT